MRSTIVALGLALIPPAVLAEGRTDPPRTAIEKGLRRIEAGAASYITKRTCFSCHHQAMAILSLSSARQRGFSVAPDKLRRQVEFTLQAFRAKKDRVLKGQGVEGASTMAGYALFALQGAGHRADDITAALVQYLLIRQRRDGAWPALARRPPGEGSLFTNAALALGALRKYGPARDAKRADDLRARIDKAFAKGREWLLDHEPQTMEDQIFRLRGLVTAGADPKQIAEASAQLLKKQRSDGSWAQVPENDGDAYATGAAVMALRTAGLKTTDPPYRKAVKYLLATQKPDGSWRVPTRTRPFQVFFDNGDPHGKSQFISFWGTNWAVLALLEQFPVK